MSSREPLRTLLLHFFGRFKRQILVGVIAIIAVDIAELVLPLLLKRVVDSFETHTTELVLPQVLGGVALIVLTQVVCRYLWRVSLVRSSMETGADLRRMFSSHLFQVPLGFYDRRKVGELMTLATSDIENMRMALGPGMIALVDSFFYCITIPIAMVWVAPGHVFKFILPILFIPLAVIFLQRKIASYSRNVQAQIGELGTMTQEMISGVRIARIYGIEPEIENRLKTQSRNLNREQIGLARVQASLGPSLEFFLSTCLVLLFSMGLQMSVGTLIALQRYLQKLMWPMSAVGLSVVYFQKAKSSGAEFYKVLEEELSEPFLGRNIKEKADLDQRVENVPMIEARNLSFAYAPISAESPSKVIFENLSFQLHEGEWLGIEGAVASGKSTLLSLLLKFYPLPRGTLFILGKDIEDWDAVELRQIFSPVLQDPFLFQGSIRYNLNVGTELSEEESMETAGVQLALYSRLGEELGERGIGLSGGQKQRIAIARALRKPAQIYLFDDPLSSVDLKTSRSVLDSLSVLLRNEKKTVIFASHHPEHLKYCDRVIRVGRPS